MGLLDEMDIRPVTVVRPDGMKIAQLLARPRAGEPKGLVVMPSAFGKKMANLSALSRAFGRCGWATLRFDLTNHVGASDGTVRHFTLSNTMRDLEAVLSNVPAPAARLPRYLLATSLCARAAIKHVAEQDGVDGLVLIVPAVNALETIRRASTCDTIDKWCRGEITDRKRLGSILGFQVELETLHDLFANRWDSTATTAEDLERVAADVIMISTTDDEWVGLEEVREVLRENGRWRRRLWTVAGGGHELARNPPALRAILEVALEALDELAGTPPSVVRHLDFREMIETVTVEKRWAAAAFSADSMQGAMVS